MACGDNAWYTDPPGVDGSLHIWSLAGLAPELGKNARTMSPEAKAVWANLAFSPSQENVKCCPYRHSGFSARGPQPHELESPSVEAGAAVSGSCFHAFCRANCAAAFLFSLHLRMAVSCRGESQSEASVTPGIPQSWAQRT